MRSSRRNYGRASALPLHLLLSTLPSAPRALVTRRVAQLANHAGYDDERADRGRTI